MDTEVYAPRPRTLQRIPFSNLRIIEHICSGGWNRKSIWIPNLIAISLVDIPDYRGAVRGVVKIADGINRGHTDVAGRCGAAIVAHPEGGKACPAFRKQVKASLPTSDDRIRPTGH